MTDVVNRTAGVVLAGGRSSRMGSSKAGLEWHGSTLLRRTVSVVGRAVDGPVVVVAAPGQPLPAMPSGVEILFDPREGLGPLQGLAVGLAAVADRADTAFVSSTDLPFLHPAFVRAVLGALTSAAEVALPVAHGFQQPLAAAYRTALAPTVADLVAAERLRPAFLFEACRVLRLDEAALLHDPGVAALDPELDSVHNVNEARDYEAARSRLPPVITVCSPVPLAGPEATGRRNVRAATLAQAADVVALPLDHRILVAVNGQLVDGDAQYALATGDSVAFSRAGER
jgi:molybdenum cofactor guanylyltransferase